MRHYSHYHYDAPKAEDESSVFILTLAPNQFDIYTRDHTL
jgi:hypothetical protein